MGKLYILFPPFIGLVPPQDIIAGQSNSHVITKAFNRTCAEKGYFADGNYNISDVSSTLVNNTSHNISHHLHNLL